MPDLSQGVDRALLAEELKYSCTNVMLSAWTRRSAASSSWAPCSARTVGWPEILDMTPEAYPPAALAHPQAGGRFPGEYCGHAGGKLQLRPAGGLRRRHPPAGPPEPGVRPPGTD